MSIASLVADRLHSNLESIPLASFQRVSSSKLTVEHGWSTWLIDVPMAGDRKVEINCYVRIPCYGHDESEVLAMTSLRHLAGDCDLMLRGLFESEAGYAKRLARYAPLVADWFRGYDTPCKAAHASWDSRPGTPAFAACHRYLVEFGKLGPQ